MLALLLFVVPLAPAVLFGSYRCTLAGIDTEETLTLRPDYSYRWRNDHGVGTWRYDRRERVFLIATGPLALRDPRDGRYSRGRIDLTFGTGERLLCRIETASRRR